MRRIYRRSRSALACTSELNGVNTPLNRLDGVMGLRVRATLLSLN